MTHSKLQVIGEGIVGVVAIAVTVILSPFLRSWYRKWGATAADVRRTLPGDEIVSHPRSDLTCAISIRSADEQVWPWVVQIGCQRAGWYSYDLLDNGGIDSARRIHPEYQQLEIGDHISATPDGGVSYPVAAIEARKALVLGGTLNTQTGKAADPADPNLAAYFSGSNTFFLDEPTPGVTRLVFRIRLDWNPSTLNTIAYRIFLEPISFVMARKMLLGIKERVEAVN